MTNIHIPEELEEMIRQIIAYEDVSEEEELERAREWLYIDPPCSDDQDSQEDDDSSWKIEISM